MYCAVLTSELFATTFPKTPVCQILLAFLKCQDTIFNSVGNDKALDSHWTVLTYTVSVSDTPRNYILRRTEAVHTIVGLLLYSQTPT